LWSRLYSEDLDPVPGSALLSIVMFSLPKENKVNAVILRESYSI
jgi:hypothetical protein